MKFASIRNLSLFAAALVVSGLAAHAADATKVSGWISDSMCGAKHAGSGSSCVKKCIDGGSAPVFVDEAKNEVWTIDNPDAVKGHYGEKIAVTGTLNADKKTVHVDSVAAAQ